MNPFKIILLLLLSHSIYSQIELWGMSTGNKIFKYLPEKGTIELMHDFYEPNYHPIIQYLTKTSSGKYIGVSSSGGQFGYGLITEYDYLNNTFAVVYSFNKVDGYNPSSQLVEASNGLLFGIAAGGVFGKGIIYSFNLLNNVFTKELDFEENGPQDPLVIANNKLYGITEVGGAYNFGTFFQFDISTKVKTIIHNFDGTIIGKYPRKSLNKTTDYKIYGFCDGGGFNNRGTIFEYDLISNVFSKKIDLDSYINANSYTNQYGTTLAKPSGTLVQASDALIYGVTKQGGTFNYGTIFKFNPIDNTIEKANEFSNLTGEPWNGFTFGPNNRLYIATPKSLVEYDYILNTLSKINNFEGGNASNLNSIILDNTSEILGIHILGLQSFMFKYSKSNGLFSNIFEFQKNEYGQYPTGSLTKTIDNTFYGMTPYGGKYGKGILFQYNPITKIFSKKIDFNNTNGAEPYGSLIQLSDGFLYGLTSGGGLGLGTLFKYDPLNNILTTKIAFNGGYSNPIGQQPFGSLIQGKNGKLYGTTGSGQVNGSIFEYNPTNDSFSNLAFLGSQNGTLPKGDLIEIENGQFLGLTSGGFDFSTSGTIFKYSITSGISKLTNLGAKANGNLVKAKDGMYYGLTDFGVPNFNHSGTIFKFNPNNNQVINLFNFNGSTDGGNPHGSLMQSSDGNLYGMTRFGGINEKGVIFKFNPFSNIFLKVHDFDDTFGSYPYYSNLVERIATISTTKSGNWNDPTVWENGVVPSNTSYVAINTNHTVDIDGVPVAVKYVEVKGTVNFINGGSLNLVE